MIESMKWGRLARVTALLMATAPAGVALNASEAPICRAGETALVLSGGAAPGLAHIGVIRALDRYGIRPTLVVGTSMGAVVGALHASGYDGEQIDSIADAHPLQEIFPGYGPRLPRPLDARPALAALSERGRGFHLEISVADERKAYELLNAALLRGNLAARGDFDALPIRFRAIASDLDSMTPVALGTGDLVQAVRASLSVPLLFPPVRIGERYLVDGALSANVPVDVARALGVRHVIVSDVTEQIDPRTLDLESPAHMVRLLANRAMKQATRLGDDDLYIRPDVDGVPKLDFSRGRKDQLVSSGYRAAVAALIRAGCAARSGSEPTPSAYASWSSHGARWQGEPPLDWSIARGETVRTPRVRRALREAFAHDDRVGLTLHPTAVGDSGVRFEPRVVPAPERVLGLGVAYDSHRGSRLWTGFSDRTLAGDRLVGSAVIALGRGRQEAELDVRATRALLDDLTPTVTARVARERISSFDARGHESDRRVTWLASVSTAVERDLGGGWIASAGPEVVGWSDANTAAGTYGLGLRVDLRRFASSRLPSWRFTGSANSRFERVAAEGRLPLEVGTGRVTPSVRVGWGRGLPEQERFALGGAEGFPGLRLDEARSSSELVVRLQASHALLGPVRMRLEVAAAKDPPVSGLVGRGWLGGARAGVGLDTFMGPIAMEYGRTTHGRAGWLVRVGEWF